MEMVGSWILKVYKKERDAIRSKSNENEKIERDIKNYLAHTYRKYLLNKDWFINKYVLEKKMYW